MQTIDCSVEIDAPASAVWRVFTDAEVTRRMGGEYVSGWKVGSSFGWKNLDGEMLTNGRILDVVPSSLLRHELYAGSTNIVTSVVTYRISEDGGTTTLLAIEELRRPLGDQEYESAVEGWGSALATVKRISEALEGEEPA